MAENRTPQVIGDEALQTAIQMEEMGRDFYLSLGTAVGDPQTVRLCRNLAAAEADHCQIFRQMRSQLAREGRTVLLPADRLAEARSTVRSSIVPDRQAIARTVRADNLDDLLALAIQMETDSIRFYSDIARTLPPGNPVEAVLREEQVHLRDLTLARRRQAACR